MLERIFFCGFVRFHSHIMSVVQNVPIYYKSNAHTVAHLLKEMDIAKLHFRLPVSLWQAQI